MESKGSERLQALADAKQWDRVTEEADSSSAVSHDGDEHLCFENGFDLAVKAAQMGALSKYIGASLKIFAVRGKCRNAYAYFVAADEEEVLARLAPLEDKPAPAPEEDDED